jgi:hypothetical protein
MTPPRPTEQTPTPAMDTEEVRRIARAEAVAVGNEAQKECIERGPICGVWKTIDEQRRDMATIKDELAENRGAIRAQGRNVTIVVAVIGLLGLAAQIAGLLIRVRHGG